MPIRIKPIENIKAKYKAKTSAAGGDYADGIKFPGRDQGEAAAAASQTWRDAVSAPGVQERFAERARESTAKWSKNASTLGARRYTEGTSNAVEEFGKNVQASLSIIASTELPARFPKGDPRNLDRVRVLNENLRKGKVGG